MSYPYDLPQSALLWTWMCSCLRVYRSVQVPPRGIGSGLSSSALVYQTGATPEAIRQRKAAATRLHDAMTRRHFNSAGLKKKVSDDPFN